MEDGGVVLASELGTDGGEGLAGQAAAEVHGYLSGLDDLPLAGVGQHGLVGDAEIVAYRVAYLGDGHFGVVDGDYLLQDFLGQLKSDFLLCQGGVGHQGGQGALEFADIVGDLACDVPYDVVPEDDALLEALGLENSHAGLQVRGKEFGGQSPLEAGKKPLLQALKVYGGTVGCEYQLLAELVQVVEYLEEGVLGAGLVGELLYIVNYQYVHRLVVVQEVGYCILDDRIHIMCLEVVGSNVEHYLVGKPLLDVYAYGLGQMGLAETGTSVNKKRIVCGAAGILGDGHSGCAAEAVAVTLDEVVEGVVGVEVGVDGDALDAGDA